jgi:hypothetical protein
MAKYVLKADNPSKLSSEKYIYFAEGAWSTNIEGGRVFPTKKAAEIALKNNPTHLNAEVIDIEGFKEDAADGDGDRADDPEGVSGSDDLGDGWGGDGPGCGAVHLAGRGHGAGVHGGDEVWVSDGKAVVRGIAGVHGVEGL